MPNIRVATLEDVDFLIDVALVCYAGEFNEDEARVYLTALLQSPGFLVLRGDAGGLVVQAWASPWNSQDRRCAVHFIAWAKPAPFELLAALRMAKDWGAANGYPHFYLANYRNKFNLAPLAKYLGMVPAPSSDWESPRS